MLKEWFGPKGFTTPVVEMEAFNGGKIRLDMQGPDGRIYPSVGRMIEFYPPYRFHFTVSALDAEGKALFENWNSVFFEEVEGGTLVTLDVHVMEKTAGAAPHLKGMTMGWNQTLDKLEELLTATSHS